nr:phospholipase-like protein [Tanacetum cinerariifolium]
MSYLLASITARITEHVKSQLPLILPKEMSNFAPSVIKSMVTESLEHVVLTKESLQPKFTYEAAASLTHFELKKILIEKIDDSQSYLTATEHRECYDGLIKSYDLNKSLFLTYDKVYPLKRSQKDKDKYEDPSAGSDRRLKKRKTSKDAEPTIGPRTKESKSGSSKGRVSTEMELVLEQTEQGTSYEVSAKLPEVMDHVEVFQKKGIDVTTYNISFRNAVDVPKHGGVFGYCDGSSSNRSVSKKLKDSAKTPNYALMWVVLMVDETKNKNEMAQKLLDAILELAKICQNE